MMFRMASQGLQQQNFRAVQVTEHRYGLPRGCGISLLGISKSCPDMGLGTLLRMSLLGQELEQVTLQKSPPTLAILRFCDLDPAHCLKVTHCLKVKGYV